MLKLGIEWLNILLTEVNIIYSFGGSAINLRHIWESEYLTPKIRIHLVKTCVMWIN